VRRIHVGRIMAIGRSTMRSTMRWIIGRIRSHFSRRRWRHGIAMASPCLARILMTGILVFWKVAAATPRVSGRRRPLSKGILCIGRKGVLSIGRMRFMAKWHQLARWRLRAAGVAVWKSWVRHYAGRSIAVGSMLWNMVPAGTGVARGWSSRGRVTRVIVVVFHV
jgi:hypothetical protein